MVQRTATTTEDIYSLVTLSSQIFLSALEIIQLPFRVQRLTTAPSTILVSSPSLLPILYPSQIVIQCTNPPNLQTASAASSGPHPTTAPKASMAMSSSSLLSSSSSTPRTARLKSGSQPRVLMDPRRPMLQSSLWLPLSTHSKIWLLGEVIARIPRIQPTNSGVDVPDP